MKTFFVFSRRERNGILVLLCILMLVISANFAVPLLFTPKFEPNPEWEKAIAEFERNSYEEAEYCSFRDGHATQSVARHDRQAHKPFQKNALNHLNSQNYPNKSLHAQTTFPTRKKFTVQTNVADTLDLQEIPGIGPAFAKRIVNYRERLGGFVKREQLLEIYGIDSAKYEKIKDAFIIDLQNIRKININTVSLNELKKHPYLDYYQAKSIIQYREKYGYFKKNSDICKINLIDAETFAKLEPYLEIINN